MESKNSKVTNFGRFYSAVRELSVIGDRDEFKRQLVEQYTNGRTDSLKEMTRREYEHLCSDLEGANQYKKELRKERSSTLKLMQRIGVDTTDWNRVDAFCLDSRIAGKRFAQIRLRDHPSLQRKLRAILGKR